LRASRYRAILRARAFRPFLAKLTAEFDRAVRAAERGLPGNRFASVKACAAERNRKAA
jgi:hypothetical protein